MTTEWQSRMIPTTKLAQFLTATTFSSYFVANQQFPQALQLTVKVPGCIGVKIWLQCSKNWATKYGREVAGLQANNASRGVSALILFGSLPLEGQAKEEGPVTIVFFITTHPA